MPLITSTVNDSTDAKMVSTLNGVNLFSAGSFYGQYGTGVVVANTTTETSILFNQAAATNNTATIPTASAALSAINLANDPSYKSPGSSLYLQGAGVSNNNTSSLGALTLGSIIEGQFIGTVGITSTPTLAMKLLLRNSQTGAVAYTLVSTTTGFAPGAGGVQLRPSLCVTAVGTSGTIVAEICAISATTAYIATPTVTTVNTNNSYILDLTVAWSAASSSNTLTVYYGTFEYII